MNYEKVLKSYHIVYRSIAPSGIIGMECQKQKIEAENQENAIKILRAIALEGGSPNIRIDKVKQLNAPEKPTEKKKKSVFGLIAVGIFILGLSAKLITKLF